MAKAQTPAETPKRRIDVLERRLQNPFGEASVPIELKDRSLVCRWFNADKGNDHVWQAKRKGWSNVRPDDVVDLEQIGGYSVDASGNIVRGERGREVLMAMPKDWREQIELAKAKLNVKNMGNPAATKAEVVEAASQRLGDEAADFLQKQVHIGGYVRDSHERVQRSLEDE